MSTLSTPILRQLADKSKTSCSIFCSFTALAVLLAFLGGPPNATAQTENFDSGAAIFTPGPNAWTKAVINPGLPMNYTHPATPNGLGLRIQSRTGAPEFGIPLGTLPAAVAFAYRTNIYGDFYMAVDIPAYDTNLDQALLLIARGNNVNPPQDASCYLVNYDVLQDGQGPGDRLGAQLQLSIVYPGFATIQLGIGEFTLIPGNIYRIVFKGVDVAGVTDLTVQAYDHTDLTKPLMTIHNQDSTYVNGVCGVGNFSRNGAAIDTTDSTFDNYYAAAADPNTDIAPAIRHPIAGTAQVVTRTPAARYTNFYPPAGGIGFTARTFTADNINVSATKLYLNGVNVSASLSTPANAPTVNFTTPTSPLVSNRVYTARIEVESVAGLKGTNIFWFDTFTDAYLTNAPVKVIECEDYNYSNGLYQTDPILVSGFDTSGAQFNGGGVGYLDLVGTEGVDYHDARTSPDGGGGQFFGDWDQYRMFDNGETYQGTYELVDFDHPDDTVVINAWEAPIDSANTRQKYAALNMKEYMVVRTEEGEWRNYTRAFAKTNYHVYLRAGCYSPTWAHLDMVTSDPTLPGQTTNTLGTFSISSQVRRDNFVYEPLLSNGVPAVVHLDGINTLRLTTEGTPIKDRRVVYLNYLLFVPSTVVLHSSATVNGTYTADLTATVNAATKTITVPLSGSKMFYRLASDAPTKITNIQRSGGNIVITYIYN